MRNGFFKAENDFVSLNLYREYDIGRLRRELSILDTYEKTILKNCETILTAKYISSRFQDDSSESNIRESLYIIEEFSFPRKQYDNIV